ncbi:MAG: diaminopimelate epimerase [Eubacteriaceae bacterium]|nr:diaminopimelate epimerase [Eubacteriaceae bacterium]
MNFCKMHGLKNDFIVIDNIDNNIKLSYNQTAFLCDRKAGIGADGLILIRLSNTADITMDYYNCDGSIAQVCGNGLRCTAKYVYDNGIIKNNKLTIQSCDKIYNCEITKTDDKNKADLISVNMGKAEFDKSKIPVKTENESPLDIRLNIDGEEIKLSALAMPNPHAVIIVDNFDLRYIEKIGSSLQDNEMFPQKVNVNFVKINADDNVELITYERGVGITQACGSGACATAAVLNKKSLCKNKINIKMPGGDMIIQISQDNDIIMTGQAAAVFRGEINL